MHFYEIKVLKFPSLSSDNSISLLVFIVSLAFLKFLNFKSAFVKNNGSVILLRKEPEIINGKEDSFLAFSFVKNLFISKYYLFTLIRIFVLNIYFFEVHIYSKLLWQLNFLFSKKGINSLTY
jgi:hypothetical protein